MSIVKIEKHNYTVEPFYQWDRNQVLEIHGLSLPSTPEVHFYNNTMERAIVRQATMDSAGVITVSVPNGLLQKPYTITAHLCVYTGATFETQYTLKLPITPRTQPADYTIEDDGDVYSFNELNNKVGQTVADLKAAEERFNSSLEGLTDAVGEKLIDSALSQAGKAADAKAVGDSLDGLAALIVGDVVWENPDPSDEFAAQTVHVDLSEYKRFMVVWKEDDFYHSDIILKDLKSRLIYFDASYGTRNITATESGFEFSSCSWRSKITGGYSDATTANTNVIPCKIIGYKY